MSALTIYSDKDASQHQWHSTDAAEIAQQLNAKGVRFERWAADRDLGHDPAPEAVIAAYQHAIDKLVAEKGYQSWDVISLRADNPQKDALRAKFRLITPTIMVCNNATSVLAPSVLKTSGA